MRVSRDAAKQLQVGRYIVPRKTFWVALVALAVIRAALRANVGNPGDCIAEANRTIARDGRGYAHIVKHCEQYGGFVR